MLIAGGAVLVGAIIGIYVGIRLRNKRVQTTYQQNPTSDEEVTYIVTEEGIKTTSEMSQQSIKWDYIIRGQEFSDMFFLFVTDRNAIIIPKIFFEKKDDIITFRNIVFNKIKKFESK